MFDDQELTLSETLSVRVKDLSAKESRRAETIGRAAKIEVAEARAYFAIVAVNGEPSIGATKLPITDAFGIEAIDALLDQRTRDKLVSGYATSFILDAEQIEQLKNA